MANQGLLEQSFLDIGNNRQNYHQGHQIRLPIANGTAVPCGDSIKVKRVQRNQGVADSAIPWICHTDFWPKCLNRDERACDALFETFDILVNRADAWLKQYPKYDLVNCETVDKKAHWVRDIYDNSLSFTDEEESDLVTHIKGLRLWYRKSPDPNITASLGKFQYRDYIPRYMNPGEKHPVFETLPQLLERINQQFLEKPLNGHVINIETVSLKLGPEDFASQSWLLSRQTNWYDEYNTHKLSFIRLYYRNSYRCLEKAGFKDFIPDVLDEGGIFHPAKYSSFTSLLQKCTSWINKSDDITVLNIQSLDTKHRKKSETCGTRFKTDELFEYAIECRFRAFFIRVSYKQDIGPENSHYSPNPRLGIFRTPRLTCKTYIPIKRCYGYENQTELMERAENELKALHANIYHVETVSLPEWLTNPAITERGERTFFDGEWYFVPDNDGNELGPYRYSLVYIIRVYFDCPPLHKALQRRLSMYSVHNNCCVIL